MSRPGRNDPCPCASGKKYKRCHGSISNDDGKAALTEAVRIGRQKYEQHRAEAMAYKRAHGEVRPLISLEFDDWRLTAVGNEIHYEKKGKERYFIDFLRTYLQNKLTREFGESELAKEPSKRHPAIQWYDRTHRYQVEYSNKHGAESGIPGTGAMNALYRLAYDLFLIKHNANLQEIMLNRLRNPDKFQGARFELICIAAMICAGYQIEFEDEEKSGRKHVECVAVGPDGLRIAVEAKSKHREGVLGYSRDGRFAGQPMATNLGVDSLLKTALAKEPKIPFLVFVEINLPNQPVPQEGSTFFQEIQAAVSKAVALYPPGECPANAFIFSNDLSYHAPDAESNKGDTWFLLAPVDAPLVPLAPDLMKKVVMACLFRLKIPVRFPDEKP